jgi:peroxiredoxin
MKQMDPGKSFKYLLGAIVVLTGALFWVVSDSFTERVVEKGQRAPAFKIVTDSGKTLTRDDFGGKLLVINFWATWCPPCVTETPSLNAMAKGLKDQGVVVVGVSVDKNPGAYRAFLQTHGIAFETSRDPEARVSASFGTFKFPETYIIKPGGEVVDKIISNRDWTADDIVSELRAFL